MDWSLTAISIPKMLVNKMESMFSLKTVGFQCVHKIPLITECKATNDIFIRIPLISKFG